jgi:hypothetical protein
VLIFADRFAPSGEAVMRLDRLEPGVPPSSFWPADENQATMQYMQAFVPVVAEIGAFSFGRPEKKMIQDVADRISSRAEAMAERLFAGAGGAEGLQLKLGTAKALAQVYAECHREEKKRLQGMSSQERAAMADKMADAGGVSLDALWAAFEQRASMLEILSEGLFGSPSAARKGDAGAAAPAAPAAAMSAPVAVAPIPPLPEPQDIENEEQTAASAGPMSFFKPGAKKPAATGAAAVRGTETGDTGAA